MSGEVLGAIDAVGLDDPFALGLGDCPGALVVLGAVGVVLLGQPLAHAAIKNMAASRYLLLKMMLIVIDLLRVPHPLSRSHLCIPKKRSEISLVCDVILRSSN